MKNEIMKTIKSILTVSVFCLFTLNVNAQDIHFSQLTKSPLFYSPALAGATNADFRVSIHHRNQWASIGSPYTTYGAALDGKLKKKKWRDKHFGLGMTLYNDRAGDLDFGRLNGNILVAYHQKIDHNNYLSGGLQVGFVQHKIDQSNAQWDNQYDGTGFNGALPSGEISNFQPFTSFDAGAGILWSYHSGSSTISSDNGKFFQLGFSTYHLSRPKLTFFNVPDEVYNFRYVAHGNASIGINNSNLAIRPAFLYQRKGKEQEFVLGAMVRYMFKEKSHFTGFIEQFDMSLGMYYRFWSDAIIPTMYFNYANWGFGISYDINMSGLTTASNYRGGIELSLKFVTPNPFKPISSSFPSL
jgi:type IX secretion system PorP/SprF family membrane protein